MGFHKMIYLYCDGDIHCPIRGNEACSGDTNGLTTIESYKQEKKKEGWIFKGRKAFCPDCAKTRRRNLG